MSTFPWHVLETTQGQIALPSEWRTYLGEYFASFHNAFLDPTPFRAKTFPCARYPGYFRTLQFHEDGSATAPCHLRDERCATLNLTDADVTLWELNWAKLGHALCHALGLDTKYSEFVGLHNTSQIGSWSADAVTAILTIQSQTDDLRAVIDGLVARLQSRFILLCPTTRLLDATSLSVLNGADAALFPLQTIIQFGAGGTLLPVKTPGELFAKFITQPKEAEEDVARRAHALIERFDEKTLAVYRAYCLKGKSVSEVCVAVKRSRTTVWRRLREIQAKTGLSPDHLRVLSPHIAKIENQMRDSRAQRIYRKGMADGEE